MEQVRHARIPVHLNAVLIGEKTVPKGCKVRNVSNHGLLLQCDADGRIQTFRDGDPVDIHLLFHRPDGTKYQTITATVRHVDAHGIGVEFCQPDAELVKLIESYRIDETQSIEATITHHRKASGPGRPATVVPHPASGASANAERRLPIEDANGRRLYYIGLLSLAIVAGILTAGYALTMGLGSRLTALETLIRTHDVELTRFQSQLLAHGSVDGVTDKRKTPVKSVGSVSNIEHERPAIAPLQQSAPAIPSMAETADISGNNEEAAGSPSSRLSNEEETTAAMISKPAGLADQGAASVSVEDQDAEKHGPWVINLLSSPNKSDADRFAEKARKQGVPVEQSNIRLKGREYFRVQLTGFLTEKQAGETAGPVKERLRLKDVWIFKL
jgi:hypothetical protein